MNGKIRYKLLTLVCLDYIILKNMFSKEENIMAIMACPYLEYESNNYGLYGKGDYVCMLEKQYVSEYTVEEICKSGYDEQCTNYKRYFDMNKSGE